ncbi:MAG: flagellar biosynthesis anti-sigma factor FlgM [Phycisphaerae bacterium]|nr:flagellar biosynthesis anti-sigma factor FlgM [Phycisphaerae bacterium]
MNDIGQVGPSSQLGAMGAAHRVNEATAALRAAQQSEIAPSAPRWAEGRDRVELSEHAHHLDAIRSLPDVRSAKVEAIKQAIEQGTYESPQMLQTALDRLLDDVRTIG